MRITFILGTWPGAQQFPPPGAPQITRDLSSIDMPYVPLGGDLIEIAPRGYRVVNRVFTITTPGPPHPDTVVASLLVIQIQGPPQLVAATAIPGLKQ